LEKNTVLAIVLSIVVIVGYYLVITVVSPQKTPVVQTTAVQTEVPAAASASQSGEATAVASASAPTVATATATLSEADNALAQFMSTRPRRVGSIPESQEFVSIKTDIIEATFTNSGGDIVSFKLLKHKDGDEVVDMVMSGEREAHVAGIAFGGRDAEIDTSLYNIEKLSSDKLRFSADYELQGAIFTLTKTYEFVQSEYMFKLSIEISGGNFIPALNFPARTGNFAYTLNFGPQIGPKFKALDERQDYRHYITQAGGKLKNQKVNATNDAIVASAVSWAAVAGKYFTLIAIPDQTPYEYIFSMAPPEAGIISASRLFIERPPLASSTQKDVFHFYLGPKTSEALEIYDTNKSQLGPLTGLQLSKAANSGGFGAILSPLEWVLKKFLSLFYYLIPNYGVSILLVTLLIKMLLFPLTKKQSEGTLRMQSISPKIKEIQEKYKDNPQKMNAEMAELYKKEGYNPLSGCLPLLIQFPIFIAMYNLFNNHFDLRGAIFIPGWIPDLSLPEYILSFAPFKIPFLGWSELRLLPFIYVGSQLLYGRITSTPDQAANQQMKMMMYVMPIVFFFVLYNVPAGLLVYWIMSNVLQMVQQLFINKYISKKRAAMKSIEDSKKKIIVPPKKRKRR
jgi:YidC/Oxa1 family membrane protein insertase